MYDTNPIFNDFSPALNILSGKVSKLFGVKHLIGKMVELLVLPWIIEKGENSPVGFLADATCVFSGRTPTVSGGQTFGACSSEKQYTCQSDHEDRDNI